MIILYRQKYFSILTEHVESIYSQKPGKMTDLTKPIQDYWKMELNKDFLKLIELQQCYDYNPFPVPVVGKIDEKTGLIPLFAKDQDSYDLGRYSIFYDPEKRILFKKIYGIFSSKMKGIDKEDFKEFLLEALEDDDFGLAWQEHPNFEKIKVLENQIKNKILRI